MARHTTAEVYAAARGAGLTTAQAALENATWGPSIGVWQIRTLKAETGKGTDRDISALSGNLPRQAQAMKNISSGGTNFALWSTYAHGTYQQFLGQATAAAVGSNTGASVPIVNAKLPLPGAGTAEDLLNSAVEPARKLIIKMMATALGFAIFAGGVILAVSPQARKSFRELGKEAKDAPATIAAVL
jgi:hypothetical protein